MLDVKALQYLASYHGKNSLKMKLFFSLPRDSKQASFCDSFCITVSSIACNFTENKPRVGRGRTYTVKIFNEIIRYCYFFFQVITYRKTRNFVSKNVPCAIIDMYGVYMDSRYFQADSQIATCELLIRTLYL